MSDIVERLRNGYPCLEGGSDHTCRVRNAASGCLCATAADTITQLRAELARKDAALRAITDQNDCGCTPVCHCNDNVGALLIFKEWAIETARDAITAQEKTDDKA